MKCEGRPVKRQRVSNLGKKQEKRVASDDESDELAGIKEISPCSSSRPEPEPEEPEQEPPQMNTRSVSKRELTIKSEDMRVRPSEPGLGRLAAAARMAAGAGTSAADLAAEGKLCFATTGLEFSVRQRRILADLGASIAEEWTPGITHLVADTFRRTAKMMCTICRGGYVVTPQYIVACRAAGKRVEEAPYLLRDPVCEAAFARKRGIRRGYSLAKALERARENGPMLHGVSVYCFPSVTEKRELPFLVSASGGTWLTRFPSSPDDDSVLLLAERTVSSSQEQQRRRTHKVYDVELLREAACTQEIRHAAYRLR